MYFWYKFLTYLFYPFAPIYLYTRVLRKKEDSSRYKEKLSKINILKKDDFLIWIHVASVGEAMGILPLIDNLLKEEKVEKILITSITLSSANVLKKKFIQNPKIIHQFLPLDIPILIKKFLEHWKPNLAIFVESEIWPNLIFKIDEKKIPLFLINARITKKTFARWRFLKGFSKKIFGKFHLCISSNTETENFLKILGAQNIKNYGNLKFSSNKHNSINKLNSLFLEKIKNRKIWCAASTHSPEEILCANLHLELKKKYENILTIIIPRHINRIDKINKELLDLNIKTAVYSNFDKIDEKTDVLLVDTYGDVQKFYNVSKNVFLGKSLVHSLKTNSGQNPVEPARLGCKIFHGPNISNFVEIYNYLKNLGVTKKINDANELNTSLVEEFEKNEDRDTKIKEKIDNYGQDILNNVIKELKKYINNN